MIFQVQQGNYIIIYKASNIHLKRFNSMLDDNNLLDKTNYDYIYFEKNIM